VSYKIGEGPWRSSSQPNALEEIFTHYLLRIEVVLKLFFISSLEMVVGPHWKYIIYTLQLLSGAIWKQDTYTLKLLLEASLKAM